MNLAMMVTHCSISLGHEKQNFRVKNTCFSLSSVVTESHNTENCMYLPPVLGTM